MAIGWTSSGDTITGWTELDVPEVAGGRLFLSSECASPTLTGVAVGSLLRIVGSH